MLGLKSELLAAFVTVVAAIAAYTDFRRGKIHNWLTIPAWIAGLAAGFALGSWQGGLDALLASLAGLLIFGWMYPLGLMGAGDVKFLMALGALGGLSYVLHAAVLSILIGGIFAAVLFVMKRKRIPFGVPMAAAAVWLAWVEVKI